MSPSEHLKVQLVAPTIWKSVRVQYKNTPGHALVDMLHDRHIGITPRLADELMRSLESEDHSETVSPAWHSVYVRLLAALDTDQKKRTDKPRHLRPRAYGLLLKVNRVYLILRVISPIVLKACQAIQRCYIFCEDDIGTTVDADKWEEYDDALYKAIIRLAESDQERMNLFWRERALTLSTFTPAHTMPKPSESNLPAADAMALGLMLNLKPENRPREQKSRQFVRLPKPTRHEKTRRQRDAGLDGVHLTRKLEDLSSVLISEFLQSPTPAILADRLMNTGYLAWERPSKQERRRDILIAAILPGQENQPLAADFIKVCWFQAMRQFGVYLRQRGLHKTEFRWIEGDQFGRSRGGSFFLNQMQMFEYSIAEEDSSAYESKFLTALQWLPEFLDERESFAPVFNVLSDPQDTTKDPNSASVVDWSETRNLLDILGQQKVVATLPVDFDTALGWISRVWKAQEENIGAQAQTKSLKRERSPSKRLIVDDFAMVHVMILLPAEKRDEWLSTLTEDKKVLLTTPLTALGQIHGNLGLANQPGRYVSVTWFPRSVVDKDVWRYDVRGRAESAIYNGDEPVINEERIAGYLIRAWLAELEKEIWRG